MRKMRTSQLETALSSHRETRDVFLGVFPSDKLPTSAPGTAAIVANTHPSHRRGEHWCAFYITPTRVSFFDSYGGAPRLESFRRLMRCRRERRVFGRRLQGRGKVCGHYCLHYILAMARGVDPEEPFGDDLNANDRLVRKDVLTNFRVA